MMTLRSILQFITANPGATVNAVLDHFGLGLGEVAGALDDLEHCDRENTGSALLDWLTQRGYVTYKVTSWDGWQYTATGKEWQWE